MYFRIIYKFFLFSSMNFNILCGCCCSCSNKGNNNSNTTENSPQNNSKIQIPGIINLPKIEINENKKNFVDNNKNIHKIDKSVKDTSRNPHINDLGIPLKDLNKRNYKEKVPPLVTITEEIPYDLFANCQQPKIIADGLENSAEVENDAKSKIDKFIKGNYAGNNEIAEKLLESKIGFVNQGNYCYINSALQALIRCKEFIVAFLDKYLEVSKFDKINDSFADGFLYLILKLYDRICDCNEGCLSDFIMRHVRNKFRGYFEAFFNLRCQNDSHEFIEKFIERLLYFNSKEVNIDDCFMFLLGYTGKCEKGHENGNMSPEYNYSVEICGNSVKECFTNSQKDEELSEAEYARCDNCFIDYAQKMRKENSEMCGIKSKLDLLECLPIQYKELLGNIKEGNTKNIYGYHIKKCEYCCVIYNEDCKDCNSLHGTYCDYINQFCDNCKSKEKCKGCANSKKECKVNHKKFCNCCYNQIYTIHLKRCKIDINCNKYFVFHLKRFDRRGGKKVDEIITDEKLKIGDSNYNLKTVICHRGGARSGHYFSYVKVKCNDEYKWFLIDDWKVSLKGIENVKNGYIFFYEKES